MDVVVVSCLYLSHLYPSPFSQQSVQSLYPPLSRVCNVMMFLKRSANSSCYLMLSVFLVLHSAMDVHVECFQSPINYKHNKAFSASVHRGKNACNPGFFVNSSTFTSSTCKTLSNESSTRILPGRSSGITLQLTDENKMDQSSITSASSSVPDSTSLLNNEKISRRNIIFAMMTSSSSSLLIGPSFASAAQEGSSTKQVKAKGAAEYDLEFYVQNLVKGNKKEGNTQASVRPASLSFPPRTLNPFLQTIINDDLSDECIAIRTLSTITNTPGKDIASEIFSFRDKVAKSFAVNSQWKESTMKDEFFFDLTAYALYRVAANLMPGPDQRMYQKRDEWVKLLGTEIYAEMKRQKLVTIKPTNKGHEQGPSSSLTLTETIPILQQILTTLSSYNFIESYRLGDKNDEYRSGLNVFDIYDDEDIAAGISVNCLISLFRPTTLTSSLQIVGEGSRFLPEFVGTTLAAMWREEASLTVSYETYFVDGEYRPNPKVRIDACILASAFAALSERVYP